MGIPLTTASRLVPVKNFNTTSQRIELAHALDQAVDKVDIAVIFGTTPFLHGNTDQTSVSPAWYQSLWHVIALSHFIVYTHAD